MFELLGVRSVIVVVCVWVDKVFLFIRDGVMDGRVDGMEEEGVWGDCMESSWVELGVILWGFGSVFLWVLKVIDRVIW